MFIPLEILYFDLTFPLLSLCPSLSGLLVEVGGGILSLASSTFFFLCQKGKRCFFVPKLCGPLDVHPRKFSFSILLEPFPLYSVTSS